MIASRVLRRIFEPKRVDVREDEQCYVMDSTVIETNRVRWEGHVACLRWHKQVNVYSENLNERSYLKYVSSD
jgi:hypothetical protein